MRKKLNKEEVLKDYLDEEFNEEKIKEFKENVIDIWEDCQKKQEQIVEVKTITKAEVKLSR